MSVIILMRRGILVDCYLTLICKVAILIYERLFVVMDNQLLNSRYNTQKERMNALKENSSISRVIPIQERWSNDSKIAKKRLQKKFGKKLSDKEMDKIINERMKELNIND